MRDRLLHYLNGKSISAGAEEAAMTLSDFLRRHEQLTGTKVVCAEGDCGACAVLVGRLNVDRTGLEYSSVCSCIQLMFQLDATHIVTVEGLKHDGKLNPIQSAMAECHGAQCGYCTPGFIVSLYDLMQTDKPLDAHVVRRGLVGNLCRCTGYDSIIRAALSSDRSKLKLVDELYPPEPIVRELSGAADEPVEIRSGGFHFFKPTSVQAAAGFRAANPTCLIVAGATDIGVQRNKGIRQIKTVMSLSAMKSLGQISVSDNSICVGATATLTNLERATETDLPEFCRFLAYFGSPLIKNAGTLAGNLVNASPIGDTLPPLFVLDGEIELTSPSASRWVNVNRFYTGYRKTVLAADEIVTRVRIPLPAKDEIFKCFKVSKRKDLDISSFGAAIWMQRGGETIADIRIAYGGVGPVVLRLPRTEEFLRGKVLSLEIFEQAGKIAAAEVTPISDVRGSDQYRRLLAENILVKFWHELDDGNGDGETLIAPIAGLREPTLARSPEVNFP